MLLISAALNTFAQTSEYKKLIASKRPGFKISHKEKYASSDRVYLGGVKAHGGQVQYYVIMEFVTFRAAIVMHGSSSLLFFDQKKKLAGMYNIGMPNELPYKLVANKLYFSSTGKKGKRDAVLITGILPKLLCAFDCYSLEK